MNGHDFPELTGGDETYDALRNDQIAIRNLKQRIEKLHDLLDSCYAYITEFGIADYDPEGARLAADIEEELRST